MPPKASWECKGVGLLACRRGADRTAAAPMMDSMGRWLARCDECAHEWTDLALFGLRSGFAGCCDVRCSWLLAGSGCFWQAWALVCNGRGPRFACAGRAPGEVIGLM